MRQFGTSPTWTLALGIICANVLVFGYRLIVPEKYWVGGIIIVVAILAVIITFQIIRTAPARKLEVERLEAKQREIQESRDRRTKRLYESAEPASLRDIENIVLAATGERRRQIVRVLDRLAAEGAFFSITYVKDMTEMVASWEAGDDLPTSEKAEPFSIEETHNRFIRELRAKHDRSW